MQYLHVLYTVSLYGSNKLCVPGKLLRLHGAVCHMKAMYLEYASAQHAKGRCLQQTLCKAQPASSACCHMSL